MEEDIVSVRGLADSEALSIKYTNKKIFSQNKPKGNIAKILYSIAEKIRCEKIGSDDLLGVKKNLTLLYEDKFNETNFKELENKIDDFIPIAF